VDAATGGGPVRDCGQPANGVIVQDSRGVIVGDYGTQNNYGHGPGRVAGGAYLEQVGDIAPTELHDRERELKELSDFCHGDEAYTWWQAGPWAGKSADGWRRKPTALPSPRPCWNSWRPWSARNFPHPWR
jgi:hypothetical protein